jgi:hyperosmotically inducible periplasmic protein
MKNQGGKMKIFNANLKICTVAAIITLAACSTNPKSPDVSANIRTALDQAGLKSVSESQDRDKGVITLTGHTAIEADKARAEDIAKSLAAGHVVANQIAVLPPGVESDTKKVNSDLDKGIDKNLDAALISSGFSKTVKYDVKNGVVTLTGAVDSQSNRARVQEVAAKVPYVQQVVNELQVKDQKATSSN